MHPGMAIDASQGADDAFRDGAYIHGWQLMHSVMAIDASQDCIDVSWDVDQSSMHTWMVNDASRDIDH